MPALPTLLGALLALFSLVQVAGAGYFIPSLVQLFEETGHPQFKYSPQLTNSSVTLSMSAFPTVTVFEKLYPHVTPAMGAVSPPPSTLIYTSANMPHVITIRPSLASSSPTPTITSPSTVTITAVPRLQNGSSYVPFYMRTFHMKSEKNLVPPYWQLDMDIICQTCDSRDDLLAWTRNQVQWPFRTSWFKLISSTFIFFWTMYREFLLFAAQALGLWFAGHASHEILRCLKAVLSWLANTIENIHASGEGELMMTKRALAQVQDEFERSKAESAEAKATIAALQKDSKVAHQELVAAKEENKGLLLRVQNLATEVARLEQVLTHDANNWTTPPTKSEGSQTEPQDPESLLACFQKAEGEVKVALGELKTSNERIAELDKRVVGLKNRVSEGKEKLNESYARCKELVQRVSELEQLVTSLRTEAEYRITQANTQRDAAGVELQKVSHERDLALSEVNDANVRFAGQESLSQRDRMEALWKFRSEQQRSEQVQAQLQKDLAIQAAALAEAQQKIDAFPGRMQNMVNLLNEAKSEASSAHAESESRKFKIQELEAENLVLDSRAENAEKELDDLKVEYVGLEEDLTELQTAVDRYEELFGPLLSDDDTDADAGGETDDESSPPHSPTS